jgi:hypothetical protein
MHRFLQDAERFWQWQDRQDLRRRFWGLVLETFRGLGVAEDAVAVVGMTEQALVDYGPVDTGLLELGKRSVKDAGRVVVLTANRRLRELYSQHEVSAEYVEPGDHAPRVRASLRAGRPRGGGAGGWRRATRRWRAPPRRGRRRSARAPRDDRVEEIVGLLDRRAA